MFSSDKDIKSVLVTKPFTYCIKAISYTKCHLVRKLPAPLRHLDRISITRAPADTTPTTPRGDSENDSSRRRMESIHRNGQNTAEPTVRTSNLNVIDGIIHNQTKCGFSFAHLNVRSIMNKLDHFRILMSKKTFDVICLNETFCDSSIADSEINLPDYSIVRRDRNRQGGGVAMYIRNSLTFIRRKDPETDDVECL